MTDNSQKDTETDRQTRCPHTFVLMVAIGQKDCSVKADTQTGLILLPLPLTREVSFPYIHLNCNKNSVKTSFPIAQLLDILCTQKDQNYLNLTFAWANLSLMNSASLGQTFLRISYDNECSWKRGKILSLSVTVLHLNVCKQSKHSVGVQVFVHVFVKKHLDSL